MSDFGARLTAAFGARGQLCLGIDAHAFLLAEWGLEDTAAGVRELGLRAVDAAVGVVGIVKAQVAFFERHGAAGYGALEDVLAAARAAGLLVIADVKRGDIGSTVDAYGQAWLSPGSPLEVDALTLVAYQGVGSLTGPIELARSGGKGVFVLAATSNPEAKAIQAAVLQSGPSAGRTVAAGIVAAVEAFNAGDELGSVGLVLGATVDAAEYGIDPDRLVSTPVLAPGFGEQGALLTELADRYGASSGNVIANVGRAVLREGATGLRAALVRRADELRRVAER